MSFISDVINFSIDANRFSNDVTVRAYFTLCVLKYYTNLELTEEETDAAIAEMAKNMGQDVEKYKAQINAEELDYVKDRALYNKVVTLVKDSAIVK